MAGTGQNGLYISTVYSNINRPGFLVREEPGTPLVGEDKGHSQGNQEIDQVHNVCPSSSTPSLSISRALTFFCIVSHPLECGV